MLRRNIIRFILFPGPSCVAEFHQKLCALQEAGIGGSLEERLTLLTHNDWNTEEAAAALLLQGMGQEFDWNIM